MGLIVNLDEFSELCGSTAETMRGHIRDVDGNPAWLVERGSRGRDYQIEAEGGLAWWRARREADETTSAERKAQLQQLRFEQLGAAVESEEALALSGRQRREEIEAALARIKLRRVMGELVEWAELEPLLATAAVEIRRQLQLVPGEFAALTGMSPEEVKPLAGLIERALAQFVTALPTRAQVLRGQHGGA